MSSLTQKPNLVGSPKYGKEPVISKIKRRLNEEIVKKIKNTFLQFRLYPSYWHFRMKKGGDKVVPEIRATQFLTLKPNYGAGIGHQMANWNSGYYFAGFFNLNYAHSPFSTEKWEKFWGFGEGEVLAEDLKKTHKVIRLPKFDSENPAEVELVGKIIASYNNVPNLLFSLEVDQGYMRQCDTYEALSRKFFAAPARKNDKLTFSDDAFNIAIHIRRRMKIETTEVWKLRGLDNEYYANVLKGVLSSLQTTKPVKVYLFSQGAVEDFPEFSEFENLTFCIEMGPADSMLHLVAADLLISSKSSFSYKPALISKNIQICPKTFWHAYPAEKNYIMADNDGQFDKSALVQLLSA